MTYLRTKPADTSGLATKNDVALALAQKANASTVGGLATAVGSKASQSDLEALSGTVAAKASTTDLSALAATVPAAATAMPPAVADSSSKGTTNRYALQDHTHASKARKAKATAQSGGTYTWVYPVPFAAGVTPSCQAIVQTAAATNDLFNVQVEGVPTNTQCVFRIARVSSGLLSLLVGALSLNTAPVAVTLHMLAMEP